MKTKFQFGSYIQAYRNEHTYTLANLPRFTPYFGSNNYRQHRPAKVGIKSCRSARECVSFVHAWMLLYTQLELCFHEQTQIVANAACTVVDSWLLVSKLYITITM